MLEVLAPLMARQYGLIDLAQARALGVGEDALRRAANAGVLHRRLPAVYALAGAPVSWRQSLLAAVLDAGPGAAVSHRAAAVLLGIARRDAPLFVEIAVPRPRSSRIPGALVHRSKDLSAEHVLEVDGIPCTGPLRTLVDLGAVERWPAVADALERALQQKQVTVRGAEWMLTNLSKQGRNGSGVFRRVLDERALRSATPDPGVLEPRMARLLRDSGLPLPVYQHEVRVDGLLVARLDFSYPQWLEAFEVDGFEAHGTPVAMTGGFEREHRLRALGWNVTHFSWIHVVRRPRYVLGVMADVLGAHTGAPRRSLHPDPV